MTSTTKVVIFEGDDCQLCGLSILEGEACEMTVSIDNYLSLCCRTCTEEDCAIEYAALDDTEAA